MSSEPVLWHHLLSELSSWGRQLACPIAFLLSMICFWWDRNESLVGFRHVLTWKSLQIQAHFNSTSCQQHAKNMSLTCVISIYIVMVFCGICVSCIDLPCFLMYDVHVTVKMCSLNVLCITWGCALYIEALSRSNFFDTPSRETPSLPWDVLWFVHRFLGDSCQKPIGNRALGQPKYSNGWKSNGDMKAYTVTSL